MPKASRQDDPPPVPPTPPGPEDCCHSGCDPCVFDLHQDALERYRVALAAWQARHAEADAGANTNATARARAKPQARRSLHADKPDRPRS